MTAGNPRLNDMVELNKQKEQDYKGRICYQQRSVPTFKQILYLVRLLLNLIPNIFVFALNT